MTFKYLRFSRTDLNAAYYSDKLFSEKRFCVTILLHVQYISDSRIQTYWNVQLTIQNYVKRIYGSLTVDLQIVFWHFMVKIINNGKRETKYFFCLLLQTDIISFVREKAPEIQDHVTCRCFMLSSDWQKYTEHIVLSSLWMKWWLFWY